MSGLGMMKAGVHSGFKVQLLTGVEDAGSRFLAANLLADRPGSSKARFCNCLLRLL